ncbi:MAG TPA: nicotinate-nucleotide--dimethylbenzimidazole phosphoribosyltransferase [Herpetosiphonaceae bacterium]|nr:nicotinate-nucleotide--dimethylbenzimidazole phosphoribosyltransferase [Herpetosiphonaceae bacterium]
MLLEQTCAAIEPLDGGAIERARRHQADLTKPHGALGQLEALSVQLAGITSELAPLLRQPTIVVAAADHGVAAEGVSAYPASVTAQMVANFLAGGAAVNVLARAAGAELLIVDAGVLTPTASDAPIFRAERLGAGTGNLAHGPAMTIDQARAALERGIAIAADLAAGGADLIALGEMGIANTTAAACLTAFLAGAPAASVTGRGTGIDDAHLRRKVAIVERAVARLDPAIEPLALLAAVGGFEIGVLAGVVLGAAARRLPVVVDGFITSAAALLAQRLAPLAIEFCIAAHVGAEPGHRIALERLGLRPLLALELRLGEGSGAALAIPLVRAAARIPGEMATFGSAGVDGPADER